MVVPVRDLGVEPLGDLGGGRVAVGGDRAEDAVVRDPGSSPHLSMITDPGVVTQVILRAVHITT